ncbi:MAG TPA: hypothetical protein VGB00_07490 [Pyrinomonadaceae bacterium]|jgi:hypothetical protein
MKRFIHWIPVILLTFALGVGAAIIWFESSKAHQTDNQNIPADSPLLAFCELVKNSDEYNGKIVRLQTEASTGNHGEYLYDLNCPGDENFKNYYDATAALIFIDSEAQEKIKSVRDARKPFLLKKWAEPVKIIATGKFKINEPSKNSSDLIENSAFHFEIIKLESVSDR